MRSMWNRRKPNKEEQPNEQNPEKFNPDKPSWNLMEGEDNQSSDSSNESNLNAADLDNNPGKKPTNTSMLSKIYNSTGKSTFWKRNKTRPGEVTGDIERTGKNGNENTSENDAEEPQGSDLNANSNVTETGNKSKQSWKEWRQAKREQLGWGSNQRKNGDQKNEAEEPNEWSQEEWGDSEMQARRNKNPPKINNNDWDASAANPDEGNGQQNLLPEDNSSSTEGIDSNCRDMAKRALDVYATTDPNKINDIDNILERNRAETSLGGGGKRKKSKSKRTRRRSRKTKRNKRKLKKRKSRKK